MDGIGENIKKILLAGIGAVATTTEKSKELLDEMVKKGELTVEQGKVLNEELKHNIKKTMKEKVNVSVKVSDLEELDELLEKMTPEQITRLKERLSQLDQQEEEPEAEKTDTSEMENVPLDEKGAENVKEASEDE
jgi:polyhydroxyalkanoate synthesis regulator phasin